MTFKGLYKGQIKQLFLEGESPTLISSGLLGFIQKLFLGVFRYCA